MKDPFSQVYLLPARVRYFFIFLIFMVIIVAGYWQVILPQHRELGEIRQQGKYLSAQLQALFYQEFSLEEKMEALPQMKFDLNEGQKKFIKYNDRDKLFMEMRAIAKRDHLQSDLSCPGKVVLGGYYVRQPCRMVATGEYSQLSRLIAQIANLPWTVVVKNYSLTRFGSTAVYTGVLALDVYYSKESASRSTIR